MAEICPVITIPALGGEIGVRACTPRAIRVRFFGPPVVEEASYVGREAWPDVPSVAPPSATPARRQVSTGRLTVRGDDGAGVPRLAVFDGSGRRLLGTPARGGIVREAVTDVAACSDGAGGERRGRVVVQLQRSRAGYEDDVHFYGLGQGGGAQLDRLGTSRVFWNSQVGHGPGVDFGVPLVVAVAPAGAY